MLANTTGYNNTANGVQALVRNTDGHDNTATGSLALFNNTGTDNTANGSNALFSNTTGSSNVANGEFALYINTTGVNNTATGGGALFYNSTGNNNVADGLASLFQNTTGNNNTALGFNANVTSGNLTNATVIGHTALVDSSNKVRLGNDLVVGIGGQVSWTNFAPDDLKNNIKENVPGLSFIKALRPVTYNLSIANQTLSLNNPLNEKGKQFLKTEDIASVGSNKIEQIKFTGLIAKEVDSAAKKVNYNFSGVDKNGTTWGIRYAEFVVPLIKAVQKLSKKNDANNNKIDSLEQFNKTLSDKLDLLAARFDQMQAVMSQCCSSVSSLTQSSVNNQSPFNTNERPRLEQNTPNPFKNNTVIKYYIPSGTTNAQIIINDAVGTVSKTITLNNKGFGQVLIPSGTLSSGNYFYNLLIDGKTMDTKKMLILK